MSAMPAISAATLMSAQPGSVDVHALEIFYTSLLVLSSLVIGWFALYVIYKLFRGQS